MSRPKTLFVAARPPYPLDTGAKIRSWHILSGFARLFDVDMLTYRDPAVDEAWVDAVRSLGVTSVVQVDNPDLNRPVSPWMFAKAALMGLPGSVAKYRRAEFTARFRQLAANRPLLVHVEHVHVAGILHALGGDRPPPRTTLDAHNVESQIADRLLQNQSSLQRKAALAIHAHNMRRFETRAFGQCDMVLAVSPEDAQTIAAMTHGTARPTVVENGVDEIFFTPGEVGEVLPDSFVFVGSMDWLPNADAMVWFVHDIFPIIRTQRPTASLSIVGRSPLPEVAALHNPAAGVVVTGTVEDVRPYVRRAAVVVAPLRFGGGTRLKILEAFAMAKGVVSTSLGCEGIACENRRHLLVADDAQSFAKACLLLTSEAGVRNALGEKARDLALKRYTWPAVVGRLCMELDRVVRHAGLHQR